MKNFTILALSGLILAGCAQQPPTSEAGMAGRAFASAEFIKSCPNHIKVKPEMRGYYYDRLREGRRLLGNYNADSMVLAKLSLKNPGACARLAARYSDGHHTFLINK